MKRITKSQKILAFSVLLLALSVTGYVLLYKKITNVHIELHNVSNELDSVLKIVESKQSTITLLEETKQGRADMEQYFISVDDPTAFLNAIDAVAKEVGVEAESVGVEIVAFETPNKQFPVELQKKAEVTLSVDGDWGDVYHFISLLETFPYVVTIDKTAITYKENSDGAPWEGLVHIHTNAI